MNSYPTSFRSARFSALALIVLTLCASAFGALPARDEAAIRAASKQYVQYGLGRDWNKIITLFTDDAVFMPPNQTSWKGRHEILAGMNTWPTITELTVEPLLIDGSGDIAYVHGRYTFTMQVPNQGQVSDVGKYMELWRKQRDGSWKLHRDIFNSDMPVAAASVTDAMLEGAWELNVAKSRFSPGPGPRRETRTYAITADGQQRATYEGIDADGKPISGSSTYRLDGKDAPITGRAEADAQALSRTGPRTISGAIKKGGRVLSTATREVAPDGKTMTITFKGLNAKGQPLDDLWFFDRKPDADEQIITKIEQDWAVALVKANVTYLDSILSPDWLRTSPEGKVQTKAESLAALRSGSTRLETFVLDDLKVRISGDTAVAFGLVTAKRTEDGKGFGGQGRFTDTFAKRDGKWVCVATHGSKVEKAGEDVVAAVKAAVERHWTSINLNDDVWKTQHTFDMNMFMPEFDTRMSLNSPAWLAALATRGEVTLNWKPRDVQVQAFGNTAVASFYMDGSVTRKADGSVDSRPRRVTEVWVNENGTWKEAHHHDSVYTALPKSAASQ